MSTGRQREFVTTLVVKYMCIAVSIHLYTISSKHTGTAKVNDVPIISNNFPDKLFFFLLAFYHSLMLSNITVCFSV